METLASTLLTARTFVFVTVIASTAVALCEYAVPAFAATERAKVAQMLQAADDLLATAERIAKHTPTTSSAAALMVDGSNGIAGQFYANDRRFKDSVKSLNDASSSKSSELVLLDLGTFETFAYGAVQAAVAQCNKDDALANLRVARSLLAQSHKEYGGRGDGDYSPPEIEESGDSLCR